jgi:transposase-like protein
MDCPECNSDIYCKNGVIGIGIKRKQRYKCLICNYTYTLPQASAADTKNWGHSLEKREIVIELYHRQKKKKKKLGYRKIAERVGGVSHGTVRNWIIAHEIAMGERRPKTKEKPAPFSEDDADYLNVTILTPSGLQVYQ